MSLKTPGGLRRLLPVRHSAVIDFGCVSFKILWIKLRFSRVKVCVVMGYGLSEGNGEEREGSGMTWTGLWIK